MRKVAFYEECKGALCALNSKGIVKPGEYSDAVIAKLRELGANAVYEGFISSRKTREAEALGLFDDLIKEERQKQQEERRSRRADIKSSISLAIALLSLLVAICSLLRGI